MKIVQINATCGIGSTGKIAVEISKLLNAEGIENYILCGSKTSGFETGISCSTVKYIKIQALKSRILGNYGFNSIRATKRIINQLKRINPDIVHLHNIHGHDCNLEMLFEYFKKTKIKLVWTFHDCWAFTGYCTYYTLSKCEKWRTECYNCEKSKDYSFFFDRSKTLFNRKKKIFSNLPLTIVTPSSWLAKEVKGSFLKEYPTRVINNGIDHSVYKKRECDFREKNNISKDMKIILGVAFLWEQRKGLDVFVELSRRLDKNKYKIVLVGFVGEGDVNVPENVLLISKSQTGEELSGIYSSADVFVNPTREENFPTVNIESLSCGTPVVTFKTGGSPEIINENCGIAVDCEDVDSLEKAIIKVCEEEIFSEADCIGRGREFNAEINFKKYVELYKEVLDERSSTN